MKEIWGAEVPEIPAKIWVGHLEILKASQVPRHHRYSIHIVIVHEVAAPCHTGLGKLEACHFNLDPDLFSHKVTRGALTKWPGGSVLHESGSSRKWLEHFRNVSLQLFKALLLSRTETRTDTHTCARARTHSHARMHARTHMHTHTHARTHAHACAPTGSTQWLCPVLWTCILQVEVGKRCQPTHTSSMLPCTCMSLMYDSKTPALVPFRTWLTRKQCWNDYSNIRIYSNKVSKTNIRILK